ncbi:MAG: hypothetical protein A2Y02_02175 [Omnitrophica bacterium GWA2_52_12]|nr:MAG: hypothetical protein A2Y02_02175 [Omnitrophica bacterium GWA2_52_12]
MKKKDIDAMINRLLTEIEEEDVGISLFNTFYQNEDELSFFSDTDRGRVLAILKKLADDSLGHKAMLEKIITALGKKCHEE